MNKHRVQPAGTSSPGTVFYANASAPRVNTDIQLYQSIQIAHPDSIITVVPENSGNLKRYAYASGKATVKPIDDLATLKWTIFIPPARRLDGGSGLLAEEVVFEQYLLTWQNEEFLVYCANGRDGTGPWPEITNQYIVSSNSSTVHTMVATVGRWDSQLHVEIWVFDQGFWQKDSQLYASIKKASWDAVILGHELKEDLIATVQRFYDSREQYHRLGVPWKRGIIFYGPPGNGKTISIKATMHTLYNREPEVPTLYVKSLTSWMGPEASITSIFEKARAEAPCYLVFEDLDSLVTPDVRSFFLNAVDGLSENEGILMVGSTNHLELLDPGIAKRPSRFDRKYLFDNPTGDLRERYAQFWRNKITHDGDLEFPKVLIKNIANITDGFSFAYMQEAFISTLLSIARREDNDHARQFDVVRNKKNASLEEELTDKWELLDLEDQDHDLRGKDNDDGGDDKYLNKYLLWREFKIQVELLRKEIEKETSKA